MLKAILNKINRTDPEKAFKKLIEDTMRATHAFKFFCAECSIVTIQKHKLDSLKTETELTSLEYNKNLKVPFLFSYYK